MYSYRQNQNADDNEPVTSLFFLNLGGGCFDGELGALVRADFTEYRRRLVHSVLRADQQGGIFFFFGRNLLS